MPDTQLDMQEKVRASMEVAQAETIMTWSCLNARLNWHGKWDSRKQPKGQCSWVNREQDFSGYEKDAISDWGARFGWNGT